MQKLKSLDDIRIKLKNGSISIGSWMQLADSNVAEIMGASGYDWVTIDMEHGSIAYHQLPNICRAIEKNGTLPFVRVFDTTVSEMRRALDAGAQGIVIPNIKNSKELEQAMDHCYLPPFGKRGVGYCRANLFGQTFEEYNNAKKRPFVVAMIESSEALLNITEIVKVKNLDAIFIGPYDLSASLDVAGNFKSTQFENAIEKIIEVCRTNNVSCGIHVVDPNKIEIETAITKGFSFIAYSLDAVFLAKSSQNPLKQSAN